MSAQLTDVTARDAGDPLREFRDLFQLRDGLIYLDGNSLGAAPRAAADCVAEAVTNQWGEGLITSWLGAEWSTAPQRIGDKIASILGAKPGEIVAADSTSVNIFKALTAALSLRPDRSVILSEATNFPTDVYMMLFPVSIILSLTATGMKKLLDKISCRYFARKRMELSTEIPKVILKIKAVLAFSGISM